jgi:acyl CoA:acetate/3-ketoacid CoA transferase
MPAPSTVNTDAVIHQNQHFDIYDASGLDMPYDNFSDRRGRV